MSQMYMMVGIPGSGKTTIAKRLMDPDTDVYISRDKVRFSIIKDKDQYFAKEDLVWREFINRIKKARAEGENVWIDATHISRGSRSKLLTALAARPEDFVIVWAQTPFDECMRRNVLREGREKVPDRTMYSMKNGFQAPVAREGWLRIIAVLPDGSLKEVTR